MMIKRIISIFLVIIILFGSITTLVWAIDNDVTQNDTTIDEEQLNDKVDEEINPEEEQQNEEQQGQEQNEEQQKEQEQEEQIIDEDIQDVIEPETDIEEIQKNMVKLFISPGQKSIENGIYQISTKINENKVLDVKGGSKDNKANIQIYENNSIAQQKFKLEYLSDGYYKIQAIHSNKVLDVKGGSTQDGTSVQQYTNNDTDAQKWVIKDAGDRIFSYNIKM